MTRLQRAVTAGAATVGLAFAALLLARALAPDVVSEDFVGVVSNLTQLLVPLLGAGVCLDSARRQAEPRQRTTWLLLGAGMGAWAFGQAVFTGYELVLGTDVPVPSAADVGFLGFPLLATAAAVHLPRRPLSTAAATRSALDGLVIATSMFLVAWSSTLRDLWTSGASGVAALAVTTAYPVGDVMILTMVLLLVASPERVRGRILAPLALGLGCFAVADTGYVFATSSGTYVSGALFDLGWVSGFLLLAVAAVLAHPDGRRPGPAQTSPAATAGTTSPMAAADVLAPQPPWTLTLLPYLWLLVAGGVFLARLTGGTSLTSTEIGLAVVLVVLVLTRQFVALADNRSLMAQLAVQHQLARDQALHDSLTGLGNRALFLDRVTHALDLNRREGARTTVMFCDLDDFKLVNDAGGHAAGDEVLRETARRLRRELRTQDTVARLGGDEFAVLLERSPDPHGVADRLVAALSAPVTLGGEEVTLSISVGVASTDGEDGVTTDMLLRRADRAMYLVKANGKAGWRDVDDPRSAADGQEALTRSGGGRAGPGAPAPRRSPAQRPAAAPPAR